MSFRVGDLVEVLSLPEVMATLDAGGMLEGMPFMPEMAQFCGKRFKVFREATKICDTIDKSGHRRMSGTVLLEGVHCDGKAHGDCEARCMVFWRREWLKRVASAHDLRSGRIAVQVLRPAKGSRDGADQSNEHYGRLLACATRPGDGATSGPAYVCQITQLKQASRPFRWWDMRPYVRDVASGNRKLWEVIRSLLITLFNWFQEIRGGCVYPHLEQGRLKKTPAVTLNLQPGDLVRARSEAEIFETLDANNKNRGLWFDKSMLPFCGRTFRVAHRVRRIINERTGQMIQMAPDSPIILLEGVLCPGDYHKLCPRSEYLFWREAWLEKVGSPGGAD